MNPIEHYTRDCPYCGEPIDIVVDRSPGSQQYTEDCAVCCRPMIVSVHVDMDGDTQISLRREDD